MQKLVAISVLSFFLSLGSLAAPSALGAEHPRELLGAPAVSSDLLASPIVRDFGIIESVSAITQDAAYWYLGGDFRRVNSSVATNYLELGLDGSVPATCALRDRFNGDVYAIVVTADSVYAGGSFTTYAGQSAQRIAKISKSDCTLDQTFSPPGSNGFSDVVYALALSNDGALFVGGSFTAYRGAAASANYLAKLDLASGNLNTTFSPPGTNNNGFDGYVAALLVSGSTLYVGGGFTAYKNNANSARRIGKLNATTGALDTTFSPAGATANGFDDVVRSLALAGGALYVGGDFGQYRAAGSYSANRLAKLNPTNGLLDTSFSPAGFNNNGFTSTFPYVYALAADATSLYVGGRFNDYRGVAASANYLVKLSLSNGAVDTTFSPPAPAANGFDAEVRALAIQGTSLYVGGNFTTYRGARAANRIAKLNLSDGQLDATFLGAGSTAQGYAGNSVVLALAASGTSLYSVGRFSAYGGAIANRFAKISKTTGAIDQTVCPQDGSPSGFDNTVYQLQFSGDALVANGAFQQYRGIEVPYTVFLNPVDGTIRP